MTSCKSFVFKTIVLFKSGNKFSYKYTNVEKLSDQEAQYAMNPATHLDFLIYNRISKKPILAIGVDGYEYHKSDTEQAKRDLLKNNIMKLYEISLLRFKTNGSGEKSKILRSNVSHEVFLRERLASTYCLCRFLVRNCSVKVNGS